MSQRVKGAIAAGHQKTAEAGMEILRVGGNAFDAAIASMLASFVTETPLTSVAGGGFFLAHTEANRNILYDFFTQTPLQKKSRQNINFYPVNIDFGGAVQQFHIGLGSMAVPGNLAGVFYIHNQLGRLPFNVVAEPAINYAKTGVKITDFQYYLLNLLKPILLTTEAGKNIYAPNGKLLQIGETLVMPDLAETLSYLASTGPEEFYEGEIAKKLVKDCQEQGGYISLTDLKKYQVIERKPLKINYRGNTLLTNPPPSSGGTLIAFALELLSQINLAELGFGSANHLQILAEIMGLTNGARQENFDAYIYQPDIIEKFLASEVMAKYQNLLTKAIDKLGSTTHISVVDNEGNAASVTTSNGEGSGYIIPGTGIMVNNMLGEEDLNPQGFHQWPENVRLSSMMAPTILMRDNQAKIVLGSGGSNRIRTAILQVISNIIDFKMSVEKAVDSPRVHWENERFDVEPGFDRNEVEKTNLPGNTQLRLWEYQNMFFGGVNTVVITDEEMIYGAGDRRRSGVSIAK
ncbi:MAG: gamma-glutamyltransferase [Microcoleaceae cyanobacterium]